MQEHDDFHKMAEGQSVSLHSSPVADDQPVATDDSNIFSGAALSTSTDVPNVSYPDTYDAEVSISHGSSGPETAVPAVQAVKRTPELLVKPTGADLTPIQPEEGHVTEQAATTQYQPQYGSDDIFTGGSIPRSFEAETSSAGSEIVDSHSDKQQGVFDKIVNTGIDGFMSLFGITDDEDLSSKK